MSNIDTATTFIGLLESCHRIEVPQIQRDYAQGREGEAEVRDGFLNALHKALDTATSSLITPMNLDFIYGSMEEDVEGIYFLPLDGQQRLTTLLLLHWYLAWRDGQLADFQARLWEGKHARFSYKVRPSSAEFFDELVCFVPESVPEDVSSVKKLLENQHWFFLNWRLDPTIQSVLTMLDAIHDRFCTSVGLYARLLDESQPAITFQLLQLENFGLSDDLYIKMNARGKPLTSFETFKARFEEDLKVLFPSEQRQIGDQSWSVRDFFARRMDTQWTYFFWNYRAKDSTIFDAGVMNLLWTVAQLSLDPESKAFAKDTQALQNKQAIVSYSALRDGGWLTRGFAIQLMALLEAWSAGGGKMTRQMIDKRYFDEEAIFQKAIKSPAALNYAELLQFNAFVLYLTQWPTEVDAGQLQEWMRVVSNLAVNTSYDHIDVVQRCMATLAKLLPESRQILKHLAETDATRLGGFSPQQIQEEVLKAKLILAEPGWRFRIEQAEGHGYFEGQIEFLLDFTGLHEVIGDSWLTLDHKGKQTVFDDYLAKATFTFNKDGLADPADATLNLYLWQRALLTVGDYLMPRGSNQSFGTNVADNPDSWKRFLRGGKADAVERRAYLKTLWDHLDSANAIGSQLEHIISTAVDLDLWRAAIVEHPQVFDYCWESEIRKISENIVYLLKRRRMNGAHAELFSYALYQDWATISLDEELKGLTLVGYMAASESFFEPQLQLSFDSDKFCINFAIESRHPGLRIVVNRSRFADIPEVEDVLVNEMNFLEESSILVRPVGSGCIVQVLRQLVRILSKKSETES